MRRFFLGLSALAVLASGQSLNGARILEQSGQLDAALAEYRQVLTRDPGNLPAYAGFRRLAGLLGRFDALDTVSLRLAGLYPERADYVLGRIEGLVGRKRGREVAEVARAALGRWPFQVLVLTDLLERGGELKLATELLAANRTGAGDPNGTAMRLAGLYERQQRYVEAARELVALAGRDRNALPAFIPRLREYGAHSSWRGVLAEVRKLPEGWPRARAEAEVLLGAGHYAEAVQAARAGMNRDELYGFAHEAEAAAPAAALALYEELGLAADQARVLRRLGRVDDALRLLRADGRPEAQFELAQIERLARKDYAAAARGYEGVLRARPGNADAAWGLASARLGLGDTAGARQALAVVEQPADSVLGFQARLAFYSGAADSLRVLAGRLQARYPSSRQLNDVLELVLLASGDGAPALAGAMMAADAGRGDDALAAARKLAAGSGAVAEYSTLLEARLLSAGGGHRAALAVLDSFPKRFPASPRRARALFEQADAAGELGDDNLRLRLLEDLIVAFPESPYAIVGRTIRAQLVRPGVPGDVR